MCSMARIFAIHIYIYNYISLIKKSIYKVLRCIVIIDIVMVGGVGLHCRLYTFCKSSTTMHDQNLEFLPILVTFFRQTFCIALFYI